MEQSSITLTVLFDAPFWVGIFERVEGGELAVAKVTFGAEPSDPEVLDFVLGHFCDLKFSPPVAAEANRVAESPKRRQRAARRQVRESGIGTRSQRALQAQFEAAKSERKREGKELREAEERRKFDLRQAKRREKRRGH